MLKGLKRKIKLAVYTFLSNLFGLNGAVVEALNEAKAEIERLSRDVRRLDTKTSLDVRSQMDMLDIDKYGDIVWIRVSDERMLRYDVFNQVRDYLRGHGKDRAILLLTGPNVSVESLSDEDLKRALLRRMTKEEEKEALKGGP